MVVAYVRVSTHEQQLERQIRDLEAYAHAQHWVIGKMVQEKITSRTVTRQIFILLETLQKNDILLCSELSRLARSMIELDHIVLFCQSRGIALHIMEGIAGNPLIIDNSEDIVSRTVLFAFQISAKLERDLLSSRIKSALATKKAQGMRLGRPLNTYGSKLASYRPQIVMLLDKKVSISSIRKVLGVCTYATLYNYLKKEGLLPRQNQSQKP